MENYRDEEVNSVGYPVSYPSQFKILSLAYYSVSVKAFKTRSVEVNQARFAYNPYIKLCIHVFVTQRSPAEALNGGLPRFTTATHARLETLRSTRLSETPPGSLQFQSVD